MRRHRDSDSRNIVYVLCWTLPDGKLWHYTGTTTRGGLRQRVEHHRSGRGAYATAEKALSGALLKAVTTFQCADRNVEPFIARYIDETAACPACWPDNEGLKLLPDHWTTTDLPELPKVSSKPVWRDGEPFDKGLIEPGKRWLRPRMFDDRWSPPS
jgi:predicted GIY-YIG superfamily endonuclease